MKTLGSILQWLFAIVGVMVTVMGLTPDEWTAKLPAWLAFFHLANGPLLAIVLCWGIVIGGFCLWSRQQIVIWPTRKEWWDKKLAAAIQASEKLIVIDSYQSSKHQFWASIEARLQRDEAFHFIILDLARTDPLLSHCVNTSLADITVLDIDAKAIERLFQTRNKSSNGGNKTIEYGYWTGESQGPLVAWTIKGKETIAAGLWQQVDGNTDLSPWLITRRGPLFQSLQKHYQTLIGKARASNNVHSSVARLESPASPQPGQTPGVILDPASV